MALISTKTIALLSDKPKYSQEEEKLGKLLNVRKNLAGWAQGQVVIPPLIMRQIIQAKHEERHWRAEALVALLKRHTV